MNKNSLNTLKGCFGILLSCVLLYGCSKSEKTAQPKASASNIQSTKLNMHGAGDHADFVITCYASNRILEIGGTSLDNGGTADQFTYQGTAPANVNQMWKITDQGTGYYKLMNLRSGKYLEMPSTGTQLIQDQSSASDAQLWSISTTTPSGYKFINKQSGLALTDQNASTSDGTPVTQEAFVANNDAQRWWLAIIAPQAYRDDDVVRFFQRTSGSQAFDGGASIALATGQSLWVTGDVFYNQLLSNGEMRCGQIFNYHNSMLIQPASHSWDPALTPNVLSPAGVQVFQSATPKTNLIWPSAGVNLGTHVYIHGLEIKSGTLTATNQYLCDVSGASGGKSINAVNPITVPGLSGQTAITYSLGMVKAADGYVYAYGEGGFLGATIFVARFPQNNATLWTFWDGTTWAPAPSTASAAAVGQAPINSNSVGYVNGKYVMIAMDYGFTCDTKTRGMYSYTSTSPTGPFTNKKLVYLVPDNKQGHVPVFYNPFVHAEFDNGQNELLVHYCVNFYSKNDGTGANCLAPCSNTDGTEDPNDYRLKGVRIPYSLMGL